MKRFFLLMTAAFLCFQIVAQDKKLPTPQKTGGMPLMEALNARKTTREFSQSPLTDQQLSNLLWAAAGVNREDGRRTAPTAVNAQQIDIYVFTDKEVYLFEPQGHFLRFIMKGDFRDQVTRQKNAADCPLILLYVANYTKMARFDEASKEFYGATDTGFISQNVYLFCASEGLNTVVLGRVERDAAKDLLKFDGKATLAQPVGLR